MGRTAQDAARAGRLGWYVGRLAAMGPREIASRVGRTAARTVRERMPRDASGPTDADHLLAGFRTRPGLIDAPTARRLAADDPAWAGACVAAADRVADHRFTFFAHPEARYDGPVDWSYDPVAQVRWPRRPARAIDHRTAPGDPKWIWELHRLQHLPWLAQARWLTGEERYGEEALAQLDGWIAQNPVDIGIGWRGAFEGGIRAISVVLTLQALRDDPALTPDRFARAVGVLTAIARRCWRDRSLHSSANNHLVGELAGLAIVALTFPELPDAGRWRRRALAGLAREADRQILPDGAGAEQAVAYQVFTADLLAIVLATLRLHGDASPDGRVLAAALDRGADHLAMLVGTDDPAPRHGDDDEGFALRLDPAVRRTPHAHLATVAALTGNPTAARCGRPDATARWFAARTPPTTPPATTTNARVAGVDPPGGHAPHGGLVVLRDGPQRLTVDVGPLGHLTIAAHGHADALAVTLARDGRELVGDPGTASYYGHPDWRTVARGTRAHATVTVDDLDQSVMGGPFLWTRHARVRVHEVDLVTGVVDAEHDGYRRLRPRLTHRRRVVATPGEATVLVVDLLLGSGTHRVRTGWPLPPDLQATPRPDGHDVTADGVVVLALRHGASVPWESTAVRGDEESGLGWWSTRLESREPSWLLGGLGRGDGPVTAVATLLVPGDPGTVGAPEVTVRADDVVITWQDGAPRRTRREVVTLAPPAGRR